MGPSSAVDLSRIRRIIMLFKKKRNFVQKVGHTTRKINNFIYDIQEDRIKRAKKFQKKHEGLVGGFMIACIATPVVAVVAGSIGEKIEEKKLKKEREELLQKQQDQKLQDIADQCGGTIVQ